MKVLKWVPLVVWVFIICFLSFSSLEKLAVPSFFSADKIAHFFMYLILEVFIFIGLNKTFRYFLLATILAIIFSALTELIQHYYVVNRYGEWMDFLANVVGLLTAYFWIKKKRKT